MSAVIKTTTPFAIEAVLIKALAALGAEPVKVDASNITSLQHNGGVELGDIFTNRKDYNGIQHFRFEQGRWILRHDSDEMNGRITASLMASREYVSVQKFLTSLSKVYDISYQEYLQELAEQERLILEEQRKARVEATRLQAIEKAKSQGYSVKETRNSKGQIQLVLTRMV
jgi:hypothetical protein